MKKLLVWTALIITVMMLAKNQKLWDQAVEKSEQLYQWAEGHVRGVSDYQPKQFLDVIALDKLKLSQREQRYINNISKSSADLLIFYNRFCDDTSRPHHVFSEFNLKSVCKATAQALALDD